jgi:hypothetical protein
LGRAQAKDKAAFGAELVHYLIKDREKGNPEKVAGAVSCALFELSAFGALEVII